MKRIVMLILVIWFLLFAGNLTYRIVPEVWSVADDSMEVVPDIVEEEAASQKQLSVISGKLSVIPGQLIEALEQLQGKKTELEDIEEKIDNLSVWWYKPIQWILSDSVLDELKKLQAQKEALQQMIDEIQDAISALKNQQEELQSQLDIELRKIESAKADIDDKFQTRENPAIAWEQHLWGAFLFSMKWIVTLPLLRLLWCLSMYYIWAPIAEKRSALTIQPYGEKMETYFPEKTGKVGKLLHVDVSKGESIVVKDEGYVAGYTNTASMKKNTKWLYSRDTVFMSLMCGLFGMTRFHNGGQQSHTVDISSDNPDEYFIELELQAGQTYFVSPRSLIAFTEDIKVSVCWHLFRIPAWCLGQIRFYRMSGAGRVVLCGMGGVSSGVIDTGIARTLRLQSLLFSAGSVAQHVSRTETFWPYLLGNTKLFDMRLRGAGRYCVCNTVKFVKPLSIRCWEIFSSCCGRLLGF